MGSQQAKSARILNDLETVLYDARKLVTGESLDIVERAIGLAINLERTGRDTAEHLSVLSEHILRLSPRHSKRSR